ncbi:MAG: hypothetical protein ACXWKC_21290 [Xanthobacteraceae bacterium]
MSDAPIALVLDFVEWIAQRPRERGEVIDVWRTSCPRLTVWEDAVEQKLVEFKSTNESSTRVSVTAAGLAFLAAHGRTQRASAPKRRVARSRSALVGVR